MLKGTMNKLKIVAIAVIALVVVVVVLQNTQDVETKLLFFCGDDAERGLSGSNGSCRPSAPATACRESSDR